MRVAAVQDGYTALVLAGKNDHISCVKSLLKAGADFTAFDKVLGGALSQAFIDDEGNTLLHTAETPELVTALLLEYGADPNLANQVKQPAC